MKICNAKLSRRHFLLAVSAGTAASTASLVSKNEMDREATQDNGVESKKGYRVTEHVRNYYRTAKI